MKCGEGGGKLAHCPVWYNVTWRSYRAGEKVTFQKWDGSGGRNKLFGEVKTAGWRGKKYGTGEITRYFEAWCFVLGWSGHSMYGDSSQDVTWWFVDI